MLSGSSDSLFYHRVVDLVSGKPPAGASVELTINAAAQRAADSALGSQRGAVVALDPRTGAILAMVSHPTYNPSALATHDLGKSATAWKQLTTDANRPLDNRAIAGRLYPPGSVFKLITAAAALSTGQYTESSQIPGPAVLDLPQTTAKLHNDFSVACGPGGLVVDDPGAADLLQHRLRRPRAEARREGAAGPGGQVRLRPVAAHPDAGHAEHRPGRAQRAARPRSRRSASSTCGSPRCRSRWWPPRSRTTAR